MAILVIGMSHKTAELALREQLDVPADQFSRVLRQLRELESVRGIFATSTCNRIELYASSNDPEQTELALKDWFEERLKDPLKTTDGALYTHLDRAAIRHLFRVAASLDSMIVGEAQILGQIKDAFATAAKEGVLDSSLNRCLTRALRVAKKVRTKTNIARYAVSVPKVSIELAQKIFGHLADRRVLVIGAGKMGRLAAKSLHSRGVAGVHVANRSPERGAELARQLSATPHRLDEVPDLLTDVDIVISSTGARDAILDVNTVRTALKRRRHRPLCIIDIAVPRDVDPAVGQLANVYLFDIDDLQQVVTANMSERLRHARRAERIVADESDAFVRHMRTDRVAPTIAALRKKFNGIKEEELARGLKSMDGLSKADVKRVTKMTNALINRILHQPSVALKEMAKLGDSEEAVETVERLFELDDGELD